MRGAIIRGPLIPAVLTPFASDGSLALSQVEQQAALLHADGVRAVFVGGTTGEFSSLTLEERMALAERWLRVGREMGWTVLIHVGAIDALKRIGERDGVLAIGAAAPLEDAWAALAQRIPALTDVWLRFASPPVRHAGTMGGNVANGSPIGDSAPMLIAAGATLVLRRGEARRRLPLEDFFLGYGQQDRRPDELLEAVTVPRRRPEQRFRAYKISKRFDQDISAVLGAFAITLDGGTVREARIAYGGMAAIPKRAMAAEAALRGRAWDEAAVRAAMAALGEDFTPITDMRASAGYRLQVARNLLLKAWLETTDPQAETRLVGDRSLAHV